MRTKKTLSLLILFTLLCSFNVCAQTKIVTGHPDFKIKIKRCEANGSTVVIDMLIENVGSNDVILKLNPYETIAFDDEGDKFSKYKINVQLGDSGLVSGAIRQVAKNLLPPEIPLKARLQIDGVPESATEFKRIDLAVECSEWRLGTDKFVKFTNIPITREGDE